MHDIASDNEVDRIVGYKNKQHKNAAELLNINLDQLKSYLLINKISNNYLNSSPGCYSEFIVNLPQGKFKLTKILRILPGRRIIYQAVEMLSDNIVIIKFFINANKFKKDYELLLNNHSLLTKNKLLTPEILSHTIDESKQLAYVIFEYITPDDSPSRMDLNKLLIAAIAKLHKKYIYQRDLHLNNFIVSNKKVYCLDVESLFTKTGYLVNKSALDNFAMFLAQLDMTYCKQWDNYINDYLPCLIPNITNSCSKSILKTIGYINKKANKFLNQRLNKYLIKTRQDNTYFQTINTSYSSINQLDKSKSKSRSKSRSKNVKIRKYKITGAMKRQNSEWLGKFIEDPHNFIQEHQVSLLKEGNTAHVHLIEYQGNKFAIKRYLKNGLSHQLSSTIKAFFKWPRAINSWHYANLLEHVNISTPSPIAYFITTRMGLMQDSYYIMKFEDGFVSLANIKGSSDESKKVSESVSECMAHNIYQLLEKLKFLKLAHRDFKYTNLGMNSADANQLTIIDLDSMKRYKSAMFFKSHHQQDIDRILRCYNDDTQFAALLKSRLNGEHE